MANQPKPADIRSPDEERSGLSAALAILSAAVVVGLLYVARDVIVPITLAILLSFLLSPAVRALGRLHMGRVTAVALTVLATSIVCFGFAAIVVSEISSLARDLPENRYNLEAKVRSLPELVPGGAVFHRATEVLRDLRKELTKPESREPNPAERLSPTHNPVAEPTKPVPVEIRQPDLEPVQLIQSIVEPLLQPLATGGLVIVFVIMILIDWEDLRDRLLRLGGRHDLHRTTEAMTEAARRVRQYLTRLLIVNMTCGVPIGVGLTVIGIPNAALWAIFVVLLRFVPYLGIVIAASFPVALAIAVDPGWTLLLWTIALFMVVELIVTNFVEPWVYGSGTGLSPVALIVAAVCWTWLWGPIGLLLSTPLTACLVVLGRHIRHLQFLDVLLSNKPALTPEETFYQRLLADNSDDATEQAEEFVKTRSFAEFCDEVVIPALARTQGDRDRGAISGERCAKVRQGIETVIENLFDATIEEVSPMPEGFARPEAQPEIDHLVRSGSQSARRGCGVAAGAPSAPAGRRPRPANSFCRRSACRRCLSEAPSGARPHLPVVDQHEHPRTSSLSCATHPAPRTKREGFDRAVGIGTGRTRRCQGGDRQLCQCRYYLAECSRRGACSRRWIVKWRLPGRRRSPQLERRQRAQSAPNCGAHRRGMRSRRPKSSSRR